MTTMETELHDQCLLCHSYGNKLYSSLKDRLFESPGEYDVFECSRCSSLWLSPRPNRESIGAAYDRYYTHGLSAGESDSISARLDRKLRSVYYQSRESVMRKCLGYKEIKISFVGKIVSVLLQIIPGRKSEMLMTALRVKKGYGTRSLDVGCGNGDLVNQLKNWGWQASGIDLDPKSVEFSKSRGLDVQVGSLDENDFEKNEFDLITMSHVIEHVFNPIDTLSQAKNLLKPGGHLIISTPNRFAWMHKRFGRNWLALDPPRHLGIFTSAELKNCAKNAGFSEVSVTTSARGARLNWIASQSIKSQGSFDLLAPIPLTKRVIGEVMQAFEAITLWVRREKGEDLYLLAKK